MTITWMSQFPLTAELPLDNGQIDISLINAAFYDDDERIVGVGWTQDTRDFPVDQMEVANDQEIRFTSPSGKRFVIRQTVPEDAAQSTQFQFVPLGIPLPVEIIGALMNGTINQPSISAAVDDAGDVHTMILETGSGLYARYSRTWIPLIDITPIEALNIVDVPPTDLEHYDMADDKGRVISIRDLSPIDAPALSATGPSRAQSPPPAVTASGDTGMIVITSAADLPDAVAWGETHPTARWYISRRWRALGGPDTGVTLPWGDDE